MGELYDQLATVEGGLGVECLHELSELWARDADLHGFGGRVRQELDGRREHLHRGVIDACGDGAAGGLRTDVLYDDAEVDVRSAAGGYELVDLQLRPRLVVNRPLQAYERAEEVRADPFVVRREAA
jgi:hypothetical protein